MSLCLDGRHSRLPGDTENGSGMTTLAPAKLRHSDRPATWQADRLGDPQSYGPCPVDDDLGHALLDAHYADWDFSNEFSGKDEPAIPVESPREAIMERITSIRAELAWLEEIIAR